MARNNKPKVRVQPEPLLPEDIKCCACGEVGGKKMVYGIDINPHWAGKPYESFPFFLCNCGAYVGCHRGTEIPMGYCADAELRKLRNACHKIFDEMWRDVPRKPGKKRIFESRTAAYKWLTAEMGMDKTVHIAHLDKEEARRAIAICEEAAKEMQGC